MRKYNFLEYLYSFFNYYLILQKNVSSNTIRSYKTTFKLFIKYLVNNKKINIKNLSFEHITRENIIDFLNYLEFDLKVSILTRNQRLAAIKSFCNYISYEDISNINNIQKILSISKKKTSQKIISFLTKEELNCYLNTIKTNNRKGIRDYTLVALMYDCAARAEEIVKLKVNDLKLDDNPSITLYGKGNKYRIVPITNNTKELLIKYIRLNKLGNFSILFPGNKNYQASTKMITHIINKYAIESKINKKIHPHVLRHTRAMHLLEAGISLIDIRDILGHSSVTTTEIYAKTNVELKRKAIEKIYNINDIENSVNESAWNKNENILKELFDI